MSRNPYFAHLPTKHNRQDLVFALDSLPRLLTSTSSSSLSNDTQSPYHSPPGSPCSPYATFTGSYHPSWSNISTSSTSSSSSTSSCSSVSSFYQQQYQQRLIQRHIRRSYSSSSNKMSTLQFSTRAQAMGFLINLLQSFQQEPCECDLVQGCFCSPEGVEDHSGLAPCYVCGEWYAEEVYCSSDEGDSSSYRKVDGRSWHERGGASLRHQVAERRVQQWLDQVVVPVASAATWSSSPYHYQQQQQQQQHQPQQPHHYQQEQQQDEKEQQTQQQPAVIRSRPSRSASCPATFSIPEEIMDPTIRRTPGFRIKRRDTIATERPASLPSSPAVELVPATSYSAPSSASSTLTNSKSTPFRFSFTSERFNAAVQESLSRRPSTTTSTSTSSTAVVPQQQSPSSNTNTINSNTEDTQAEAVAEQQTEAEPRMEAETATETEAEAVRVAETETASTSAQTTPSPSSFVSSPSFTSSRGYSPSSSTAAGKIDHRDQYGVMEEPPAVASSIVAQQPSSTLSPSASMGTRTGTGTGATFSTFSFGKSQLDTPQAVTPTATGTPLPPQAQRQQEAGRGRARRRGHGHVRQLAQSHILVTGSPFHHSLLPQLQQKESEPGETSGPMMVMSPSFSNSSSSPSPPRAPRSQQHGLLTASSPPLTTTTLPLIRKKKTVSFALPPPLPLPHIVITPPSPTSPTLTGGGEAVAEWRSCCNTPSPHPNTNTNNNCDINSEVTLPVNPRQQSTPLPLETSYIDSGSSSALLLLATTRLVQTAFQSIIALGWWSCSSLSAILFFTFPFPFVASSPCT